MKRCLTQYLLSMYVPCLVCHVAVERDLLYGVCYVQYYVCMYVCMWLYAVVFVHGEGNTPSPYVNFLNVWLSCRAWFSCFVVFIFVFVFLLLISPPLPLGLGYNVLHTIRTILCNVRDFLVSDIDRV